jgi:c-di-GMP-binding flagellar brake protein YcgR
MKALNERRRFKRFRFMGGGIAMFPLGHVSVLGSIRDISLGGLGVTYIDEGTKLNESQEFRADVMEEKFYWKDLHCKSRWDKEVVNDIPVITARMRQGGLQFINLSPEQLAGLKEFIRFSFVDENEIGDSHLFYYHY